jgi:creatinine amidohydrolase
LTVTLSKVRYEEMLPHEIVEARNKVPIAYLPIGNLEWHGEHLVVGTDAIKAHTLAICIAERGGGLVFPPLFYGENREHGNLEFDFDPMGKVAEKMGLQKSNFMLGHMRKPSYLQDVLYIELLIHILYEIESLGFKVIIMVVGHYPSIHHANEAIKEYSKTGKAKVWAVCGYEIVKDIIPDAGDHAAKWETSLLMALRPECVDMERLPKNKDVPLLGIVGIDPRETASKDFGEFAVNIIVDRVLSKARQLLAEQD